METKQTFSQQMKTFIESILAMQSVETPLWVLQLKNRLPKTHLKRHLDENSKGIITEFQFSRQEILEFMAIKNERLKLVQAQKYEAAKLFREKEKAFLAISKSLRMYNYIIHQIITANSPYRVYAYIKSLNHQAPELLNDKLFNELSECCMYWVLLEYLYEHKHLQVMHLKLLLSNIKNDLINLLKKQIIR